MLKMSYEAEQNTSFVLIHLLGKADSAARVTRQMPATNLRSTQRALVRLDEAGLVDCYGVNNPRYSLNYDRVVGRAINPKLLENDSRPASRFNPNLVDWLLEGGDLTPIFWGDRVLAVDRQSMTRFGLKTRRQRHGRSRGILTSVVGN